jgi:pimeloyl-ACP methyl ester carboxylesterase
VTPDVLKRRLTTGEAVSFVCEGSRLVGSLHRPETANPELPGIVLLNQGPLDRSGAHRLYVKLAWRLTAMGFTVLRFDARAVGDSEGVWDGEPNAVSILDAYGEIQRGAWVPDARAAIEFMKRTVGSKHVLLGGVCGGAATALLAGADHSDVVGMFIVGTPVTRSSVTRLVADLPEAIIQSETRRYFMKLADPRSWLRLLSFKTDYKTLVEVFMTQVRRRLGRFKTTAARSAEVDEKVNMLLLDAIASTPRRKKQLLIVFGENDHLWHEFKEQMWRFGDRDRLPFALVTIPDANHTLTEDLWQEALFDTVTGWATRWTAGSEGQRRSA